MPAIDSVGIQVYNAPILVAVTWGDALNVLPADHVEYRINVTNLGQGPITSIVARLEWTDLAAPSGDTDWAPVQLETLGAGGVITENTALYTFDVSALVAPFSLPIVAEAAGRSMRIGLSATGGAASSAATVTATRRS